MQSALVHPVNLWNHEKSDLSTLAAAYAFRICSNHPFIDGNKRVSFVTMRLFLLINSKNIQASKQDKMDMFMRLDEGSISEKDLAVWVLKRLVDFVP